MKRPPEAARVARARILAGAALAVIAVAAGGLWYAHDDALSARLLMAVPDGIQNDPPLHAYAIRRGRAAFAAHCASCHGADLAGDPTRGIPDLADRDWLYGSGRVGEIERTILYGIRSGHPKAWNLAIMPAFATANSNKFYKMEPLTPREVADVALYVYGFSHPGQDAQALARGWAVFHKNGFCFDCHGGDGRGDPAIGAPDLTDGIWLTGNGSLASITDSIAHGLQGICPEWIGRLPAATIRSIAVYLNAVSAGPSHE